MPNDVLRIEALGRGGRGVADFNFEDWASFSLRSSMVEPSEVSVELGDSTGWSRLTDLIQLGSEYQVFLGDRPRLRGRVEALDAPSDARSGTTQRIVVRTRLSDGAYNSAPQGLRLKNATIKQFVLAVYSSIGLTEADFDFRGDVSRDLMTGKSSRGRRSPTPVETLTEEQAKVQPTESCFAAADRHLRRHGLLHWDGPDGRIIVAAPDDQQDPIYFLQSYRSTNLAQINNTTAIQRALDVSSAPTHIGVFGKTGKVDFSKAKIGAVLFNPELIAAGFRRSVVIVDEGVRTKAFAERRVSHEFATRNRGLDRLIINTDGLSYREGSELVQWAPDTVADVVSEDHGGALGAYYLETVDLKRNAGEGDTSALSLVRQGVWEL
jgi:prophage tail gpP-like protein